MTRLKRPRRGPVGVLLLLTFFATAATSSAQVVASASIRGRAIDESGGALPGVTVTATSPALLVQSMETTTDGEGAYSFANIPIGEYKLVFALTGFQQLVRENVLVTAGFTAAINATLKVGAVEETITVSGQSPVVDATNTSATVSLSSKYLTEVIPATRDLGEYMVTTPGVTPTARADLGGGMNAGGYYVGYVSAQGTYLMDGVNTRQATGGASTQGTGPDMASLEEMQVVAVAGSAEQALPGLFVNMVIKSGGNNFHGRYEIQGQNDTFQSSNLTDALKAQGVTVGDASKSMVEPSADLGGPVLRDKVWFYGAYRYQRSNRTILGFAKDPGADRVWLTSDDVAADRLAYLKNYTGKLTYQAASHYKVVGMYTINPEDFPAGIVNTKFTPYPATTEFFYNPREMKFELQGTPSSRVFFTAQLGRHHYDASYYAKPEVSGEPSTFDNATQLNLGPNISQPRRPRENLQPAGSISFTPDWSAFGRHEFKAGFSFYRMYQGSGFVNGLHGNYQLIFDTVGGVPHQPFQIRTYNFPLTPRNRMNESGEYIQDTWRVGRRLTLNLGLRNDQFRTFIPQQSGTPSQFGAPVTQPELETGTWRAIVPRLGGSWDVTGDGKTVAKATWGLYNHTPSDDFSDSYNKNNQIITTYRWRDLNADGDYQPGEVNLDTNGPDFVSITGTNNILNPDLKNPHTKEVSASLEREVMPNFGMRFNYIYVAQYDLYAFVNVLRPYSVFTPIGQQQDPGPDGRLGTSDDASFVTIYDYPAAYRGSSFVGNKRINAADDHKPTSQVLETVVTRRTVGGWGFLGSVTATKNHSYITLIPSSPNDDYFNLNDTWDWQGKVTGSYQLPRRFVVSGSFQAYSGVKGQRTNLFRNIPNLSTATLRLEPFGTEKSPPRTILNVRVGKDLSMRSNTRLRLSLDLLNALNGSSIWSVNYASGATTFNQITSIDQPRIIRGGVSFTF